MDKSVCRCGVHLIIVELAKVKIKICPDYDGENPHTIIIIKEGGGV